MPWVRLDDKFPHNPKVLKAGPLGLAMHVAAICYCNQHLTDGFVPNAVTNTLLNLDGIAMRCWANELTGGGDDATAQLIVDDLVDAGLWHTTQGGWIIHDYLEYQPSKSKILKERSTNAERQERWRHAHSNGVSNGTGNGHVTGAPTPRKKEELEEKKEQKKLTQPSAAKTPEKVSGTNEPTDLHRAYYDTGIAYLGRFGKSEKDARTLLGQWSRDLGGFGQAGQALAQAQTIGSPDPVAYMQGACQKQKTNRNGNGHAKNGNGHTVVGHAVGSREWWEMVRDMRGYNITPEQREKYETKYGKPQ